MPHVRLRSWTRTGIAARRAAMASISVVIEVVNDVTVMGGNLDVWGVVTGDLFAGDVSGRVAVIVDDMISTGTTIVRTARRCREAGATGVIDAAVQQMEAMLADSLRKRGYLVYGGH